MEDQKLVIDCSIPSNEEGHVSYLPLDEDDLAQKEKDLEASQVLAWQTLRITRNGQLSATDWTQMPDAPLSNEDKMVWQKYRQELRDITNGLQNPSLVEWPNGPQL